MAAKPDKPTRVLAMQYQCHMCMGHYADGKVDCEVVDCSLYPWMPYRKKEPDLKWLDYNPKSKGLVTWEDSGREMSEEQKAAAAERLREARERNGNGNGSEEA